MNKDKFVGLIGLGYWGKNILRNLCELGVLHTAGDLSSQIISERSKEFHGVNYTTKFEDILNNKDIKAVAIATPAATHYEYVKQALLAGKDVFVMREKRLIPCSH